MSTIFGGVGGSQTFAGASGGKVYGFNTINSTAQQIVPSNPQRQRITFHNPGTVDVWVAPGSLVNAAGNQVPFTPVIGAVGGCFLVYANGGSITIMGGEIQFAWSALSVSTASITAMDSNI